MDNNLKTKIITGTLIVISLVFLLYISGNLSPLFQKQYINNYCGYDCNGRTCSIYTNSKQESIKKEDSFISKPFLSINNFEYTGYECKYIKYLCEDNIYESIISKNKYKCINKKK